MSRLLLRNYAEPWTPFDLGTSLIAWWRASDIALMVNDGSNLISSWKDCKGGLAVTAATTARGTFGGISFNSAYPGITLDGTANCYATTTLTGFPTGSTAGEIWAVADQQVSSGDSNVRIAAQYGGITGGTLRRVARSNTNLTTVSDGTTNLNGVTWSGPGILRGAWDATPSESSTFNGTLITGSPKTTGTLNTGTTRLRIGASNVTSATQFWQGVISDVLVTLPLNLLQQYKLESYLAWGRGLA